MLMLRKRLLSLFEGVLYMYMINIPHVYICIRIAVIQCLDTVHVHVYRVEVCTLTMSMHDICTEKNSFELICIGIQVIS